MNSQKVENTICYKSKKHNRFILIHCRTLLNPDTSYCGHKGQGYQVQIMETFCEDPENQPNSPNLTTHVDVEPALVFLIFKELNEAIFDQLAT